jgi:hypothetical protein
LNDELGGVQLAWQHAPAAAERGGGNGGIAAAGEPFAAPSRAAAGEGGLKSVAVDPFWSLHPQDGAQFFAYAYGINMVLNKLTAIAVVALEQRKVPMRHDGA